MCAGLPQVSRFERRMTHVLSVAIELPDGYGTFMTLKKERNSSSQETMGDRLLRARTARGLGSRQLSEEAGLSDGTVSALETGRRGTPTIDTVEVLARALGVTPEWLAWGRGKSGL
jgi:ribosome-binding protein aMBF1 (putative translation factor)